jgi:peptide/nickel transport system permease protein
MGNPTDYGLADHAAGGDWRFAAMEERAKGDEVELERRTPDGGDVAVGGSMARQMLRVFLQNKLAVLAAIYVIVLILLCVVVPQFYHSSYWSNANADYNTYCYKGQPANAAQGGSAGPSWSHPLGCTTGFVNVGLLFYSGRFSLAIGILAGFATMLIGTLYGIVAGYKGGIIDATLMRLNDIFLSIPGLYLLLLVITIYGHTIWAIVLVVGFTGWFGVARLMRGEAQIQRDREFSQAARAMGATSWRVMRKHVLPNSVSTMVTAATFAVGDAVIVLSTIGFLGLALQQPDFDWGTLIQNASTQFESGYWWTLWPIAVVFILFVLSTNYIGDALRDAFEVRLQER